MADTTKTPSRKALFQDPNMNSEESIHTEPTPQPTEIPAVEEMTNEQLLRQLSQLEAIVRSRTVEGKKSTTDKSKEREEGEHSRSHRTQRSPSRERSISSGREKGKGKYKRERSRSHRTRRSSSRETSESSGRDDRNKGGSRWKKEKSTTSRRRSRSSSPEVRKHCLKAHVFKVQPPPSFVPAALQSFNGDGDAKEHLRRFNMAMLGAGAEDPFTARLFCTTLMGPAADWLDRLPPRSVGSMAELAKLFLRNFTQSKNQPKSSQILRTLVQGKKETLRDYMSRYTATAVTVEEELESTHLYLLKGGVRGHTPFSLDIAKDPPRSLVEFKERTWQFIRAEEADEAKEEIDLTSTAQGGNTSGSQKSREVKPQKQRNDKGPRPDNRPRYGNFTQLNTPRARIYEVAHAEFRNIERPTPIRECPKTDRGKKCEFHNCLGHTTEDCRNLKEAIEALVSQGRLKGFVQREREEERRNDSPRRNNREERRNDRRRSDRSPERRKTGYPNSNRVVNTIIGGFGGGGDSMNARKRHLREVNQASSSDRRPAKKGGALSFDTEDLKGVIAGHEDALVVSGNLVNTTVKRLLIDSGSSSDILFAEAFDKLGLSRRDLKPCNSDLIGFSGERNSPLGYIDLHLTLGSPDAYRTERSRFLVVECPSAYNGILGRPTIHAFEAIPSTIHMAMKFFSKEGKVVTVRGDQKTSRSCFYDAMKITKTPAAVTKKMKTKPGDVCMVDLDPRIGLPDPRPEPEGDLQPVGIGAPGQTTMLGRSLPTTVREKMEKLLFENRELFAWTPADMPGINPDFFCHRLAVREGAKPITQKRRKQGGERHTAIKEQVAALTKAEFIREVQYADWVANPVMVKKNNGKWRMCVDFTDLNKSCPKDPYPLPNIDQLVDNSAGFEWLSFMDAYSGYNQISMYPPDEEKTSFYTGDAICCYKVMPFGLKNAGATYQRMMNKIFTGQIGRNLEIYVDDMIVKTPRGGNHLEDLSEVFSQLRKHNMRLNPEKCAFGVPAGKFLGFLLTSRGIEANPDKCRAVTEMISPRNLKEVQKLNGKVAALTRFIPKSAQKSLPLFGLLKKGANFEWTGECEKAFEELKLALTTPPILGKPVPGEKLYLYLSVGPGAISSVLVREEAGSQTPLYFISKALQGAETRYQQLEKLAFALITTARRLRHYFQSHVIVVRTNQPMRQVLHRPDLAGRMITWAMELSEHDIQYESRSAIKAQALADFVVELAFGEEASDRGTWTLYVDGSSNNSGSGAGIIIENPEGTSIEHSLRFGFPTSNNQAEYEALIAGLHHSRELGAQEIEVWTDSQLVVSHINGSYQTKTEITAKYLEKVKEALSSFREAKVQHIPRERNVRADILSKLASTQSAAGHRTVIQSNLPDPSVSIMQVEISTWMDPIKAYILHGQVPESTTEARQLI